MRDFDIAVFSYKHHEFKPDLFSEVIQRSDLNPEEILVLDDDEEMLESLKQRGFKTAFCDEPNKVNEILKKRQIL